MATATLERTVDRFRELRDEMRAFTQELDNPEPWREELREVSARRAQAMRMQDEQLGRS